MTSEKLFFLSTFCLILQFSFAQNYLRVSDPDAWDAPVSIEPDWHMYAAQAQFDEVTIVAEPQGIYTEIGFYATISTGPDAWSWSGEYEIIWQFDLPSNSVVHDSWLWIEEEIIKADVIDFWTALETYEGIVDRNEDPSFLYRLPDNRYEIRIYPLFEGSSRRVKMSFLVPAKWDAETVTTELLNNLLQGTDYLPENVDIRIPITDQWQALKLKMDNTKIPFIDTVIGGTGNLLRRLEIDAEEFANASEIGLETVAPYSDNNTFVSTYSDGGENFYQLVYYPSWENEVQEDEVKKKLLILDFDEAKSSIEKTSLALKIQQLIAEHFSVYDAINIAYTNAGTVEFFDENWTDIANSGIIDSIPGIVNSCDNSSFEQLLNTGFLWAQDQGDATEIIVIAANENFVYPPVADVSFSNISNSIPADVTLSLLDLEDENVSVIFYNNEEYHGNEYFYQLLANSFNESEIIIFRSLGESFSNVMSGIFPSLQFPEGIIDYTVNLENGICFNRYSLNSIYATPENRGIIIQTGKYLGQFPMNIDAYLITQNGDFYNLKKEIFSNEIVIGDTLMREMWYGPHLNYLESQLSSDQERELLIEKSKAERVLTGLTAFLALEPSQGGDPCIDCLFNDGDVFPIATDEDTKEKTALLITPNPASDIAKIVLKNPEKMNSNGWQATIYDESGKVVLRLENPVFLENAIEWNWMIGSEVKSGIYYCLVQSDNEEFVEPFTVFNK